jgi:glutamine synthetase
MAQTNGFIAKHGLWSDEDWRLADEIKRRVEAENIKLIRVAWADPHGASRAKTVTVPALLGALKNGYNINVATHTLDLAGARVFGSFIKGGGMGLPEMTGSPNLTIVPDPSTFRVLPWAPEIGWILCDEYFENGVPFHFSPRQLLKRQLKKLADRKMDAIVGLEVEWYLLKPAEDYIAENLGSPGVRGRALRVHPAEPGFSLHSETNFDLIQPALSTLADTYQKLGLPLSSIENEWGPGQVECTFSPEQALRSADNLVLFRTATRQVARRLGYFATFMMRPGPMGYYSSGWHLHQSLIDKASGKNLFTSAGGDELLSPLGMNYLGGLLHSAVAATPFTTPTVNGYRRFRQNSLAPDRCTWSFDHRGVLMRVLGGPGSNAARIENRVGEPSANPYLFILSQLVSGLDGIDHKRDPGPRTEEPYAAERPLLPKSLTEALDALGKSDLMRQAMGGVFIDYFLKLKRSEAGRFTRWLEDNKLPYGDETTAWEQDEYFDIF